MTWLGRWKNPGDPVNGSRVIGTQYTPSSTAYVEHFITLSLTNTSAQTVQVDLLCDTATPPTTLRGRVSSNFVGALTMQLAWVSKPGENVKLVSTGTGASAIVAQWEIPLGAQTE